jgi:hypothetical protein
METTPALIVLTVDDTFRAFPQAAHRSGAGFRTARLDGASGLLYSGSVFNSRRHVAKLIVPLALEGGQT